MYCISFERSSFSASFDTLCDQTIFVVYYVQRLEIAIKHGVYLKILYEMGSVSEQ